ncbi:protein disulfide-isomerase precursor [Gaertneriomyces sp. JEL0708]|nr:protein disulfide-isomerase precursor [Gaertneriomyces sp. JEL0708]
MRIGGKLLSAFAVTAAYSALGVYAKDAASDVVVLTKSNFDSVAKDPISLIEFYAPWCGHCKALAPEYEKAATELKGTVPLAKVDCTVEEEVCRDHGVEGYPTLKVFRNGESSPYKGQRTADSIVSYMQKQALPSVSTVTEDTFKHFSESDKVVVVGFFEDTKSTEYKAFEAAAESLRDDYVFGAASDKALLEAQGIKAPGVVLYKKFDEGKNVFEGKFATDAIQKFVKANGTPLMDDISPNNYATYVQSGLPLAYLFINNDEQRAKVGPAVEAVAKQFKGKVNFAYIDATKFGQHGVSLGLKEQWPAVVISEPAKSTKYPFDQSKEITTANIESFVKDFVSGSIKPFLKSEEVPESNDGPVKVAVLNNYNDLVLNKNADVLVEFYAPWCGHCKNLAPIWDSLGEKVKTLGTDKIVIAKMDATANDLPADSPFHIEGFPTIKLFKAGNNEIVDFSGDRTLDGFVSFLKTHAVNAAELESAAAPAASEPATSDEDADHDEL